MNNYRPTFEIKETAQSVKDFVKANNKEVWKIFKPLAPYIIGLNLFDAIITYLYFPDSENGFALGSLLAVYFMTVLAISWHRVVINGPNNYTPMNPFKPQKHELAFIGVGILVWMFIPLIGLLLGASIAATLSMAIASISMLLLMIGGIYLIYKFCLYFPAKAINANITLKEAFKLTNNIFLKLIFAPLRASLKLYALMIALYLGLLLIAIGSTALGVNLTIASDFILALTYDLYFNPLLTVIGVTALSNYYLLAVQKNTSVVSP